MGVLWECRSDKLCFLTLSVSEVKSFGFTRKDTTDKGAYILQLWERSRNINADKNALGSDYMYREACNVSRDLN